MSQTFWTAVKEIPGQPFEVNVMNARLMFREEAEGFVDALNQEEPGVFRVARCEVEMDLDLDRTPDQVNPPVGPPDSDRSFLGTLAQRVSVLETQAQARGAWVCRLENLESKVDTLRRWRDRIDTTIKSLCDLFRAADAGLL